VGETQNRVFPMWRTGYTVGSHRKGCPMEDLEARRREEQRPLEESGEGEAEGFEQAEQELIDNAEHGDGGGDPEVDAFTPEAESDRSEAEYGEPDEVGPTDTDTAPDR
jgi:hypothetical protein